jgi:hypothetical protein
MSNGERMSGAVQSVRRGIGGVKIRMGGGSITAARETDAGGNCINRPLHKAPMNVNFGLIPLRKASESEKAYTNSAGFESGPG